MTHLYEAQDWSWVAKASKRALERGLKYDFKESLVVFSCIIFDYTCTQFLKYPTKHKMCTV